MDERSLQCLKNIEQSLERLRSVEQLLERVADSTERNTRMLEQMQAEYQRALNNR